MRLIFFALLGVNVAALVLQLTVWSVPEREVSVSNVARGGEKLRLLSELEGSRLSASRASAAAPLPAAESGLCHTVGPFPRLLSAEYFVEALQALDVVARVDELEVPEGAGYWVHLPPEASKKEALKRLREVQAKQIDSYLIPKGELANGISFGMFTRAELAAARRDDMRSLGYDAEIREITRTRKEVWVVLGAGQAQKLSSEAWLELLSRENNVEKQQNYCSGVASE
ncbi:SPOR domain-containing protein [Gilvimarinus sp. SDUM040013]|uniref:SPOR domain-containing protein n=1 Tax=Gilvimarinus gilvus TaxID=3058038 RepID=A0ABU4S719_9GAMM|nr:SPOR domain-containing protein [Gilvimarinus sp. SDUM040013]MDO3385513.1 SPOR domain-containing protein [Gilvimarinus sp. SDUM040013]MDX6851409.1 SPOR domain-containing protein [Gilvimarinus sp. SDUM040013]